MTLHYLAGELSLRLARLETVATDEPSVRRVADLRHETETMPPSGLSSVIVRAVALSDSLCWDSLMRGDAAGFTCQATLSAELCEFGACAGLLGADDPPSG